MIHPELSEQQREKKTEKKKKIQKLVEVDQPIETKGKSNAKGSRPKGKKKAKKFEKKEKEKHEEKQVRKQKIELDQLNMTETKETRIRRKLTNVKPPVPAQESQLVDSSGKKKMKSANYKAVTKEKDASQVVESTTIFSCCPLPIYLYQGE